MQIAAVGTQVADYLSSMVGVSEAAFAEPPWSMRGSHLELLGKFLQLPNAAVWLAFEGSEVLGLSIGSKLSEESIAYFDLPAAANAVAGDYHLTWRAVHPMNQGRGLGRILSEVRIDEAVKLGCSRAFVSTLHSNLGTLRMYESMGFTECGRKLIAGRNSLYEHVHFVKEL